jgi:hydroxyacylglutathione hydrolase
LRIIAVLETHVHADFVSGAPALAAATGAPVYASRLGGQSFAHIPVDNGFVLTIGTVRLTAIHTPGHTPEHIAWQAEDTAEPDAAPALFTGDALFVGDVGRPDLLGEDRTGDLVDRLYGTVTRVFMRLPDEMVVYPGHTAGSSCGKKIGSDPQTTIGAEKAMNYAFKPNSREAFAAAVMSGMPEPPAYYPVLKRVNAVGATPLDALRPMGVLSVDQVEDHLAGGSLVVDIRSKEAFAATHVPGSVFVGAGPSFATWMGWLAPYDRDVVLIGDDTDQAREALIMLHRIGIDRVAGYHLGVDSWRRSGRALESLAVVSAAEAVREWERGELGTVLDVRSDDEFEMGHIDGANHLYLARIARGEMPQLDREARVTVVCGSGYRSTVAASLMQASGFAAVRNLAGGMDAWNEARAGIRSIAS